MSNSSVAGENQTGWSTPVAVLSNPDGRGTSLMVSINGAIHFVSGNGYATAASPDSTFSASEIPAVSSTPQAVMDTTGTAN